MKDREHLDELGMDNNINSNGREIWFQCVVDSSVSH
jgi:hypothetical protein